jgi:hypothetical protein
MHRHFPRRARGATTHGKRDLQVEPSRNNDARFGTRMKGEGIWADLMHQRMRKACERFGLGRQRHELDFSQFRAPGGAVGQQSLF